MSGLLISAIVQVSYVYLLGVRWLGLRWADGVSLFKNSNSDTPWRRTSTFQKVLLAVPQSWRRFGSSPASPVHATDEVQKSDMLSVRNDEVTFGNLSAERMSSSGRAKTVQLNRTSRHSRVPDEDRCIVHINGYARSKGKRLSKRFEYQTRIDEQFEGMRGFPEETMRLAHRESFGLCLTPAYINAFLYFSICSCYVLAYTRAVVAIYCLLCSWLLLTFSPTYLNWRLNTCLRITQPQFCMRRNGALWRMTMKKTTKKPTSVGLKR